MRGGYLIRTRRAKIRSRPLEVLWRASRDPPNILSGKRAGAKMSRRLGWLNIGFAMAAFVLAHAVLTADAAWAAAPIPPRVSTATSTTGDLNQLYGPSWSCLSIDARSQALYQACLPCEQSGQDFYEDSDTSGHCVPKPGGQQATPALPPAPVPLRTQTPSFPSSTPIPTPTRRRAYWGAIAAAIWQDGGGEYVRSGVSWNYASKSQAIAAAISQCQDAGGGQYCKSVGTFSNGACGYISVGNSGGILGGGRVCYGLGNTESEAMNQCQIRGCTCKAADGGCTARPN